MKDLRTSSGDEGSSSSLDLTALIKLSFHKWRNMKILRKHWFVMTWGEWKIVFDKFQFHLLPSLIFEIDYGIYTIKFYFLGFRSSIGYSPFPFPKSMWETSFFNK